MLAYEKKIDRPLAKVLTRAMEEAGLRPSQKVRRVGDFTLGALLFDGSTYQDWEAAHVSLAHVKRRVRLYPVAASAGAEARETLRRAAEREFQLLEGVKHQGILKAEGYVEHERGPALIFEHDPKAVRLDFYLTQQGARVGVDFKMDVLRQLAEALRYAHEKKLVHRALSPQSILLSGADTSSPRVQLFNWQTGARSSAPSSSTAFGITGTVHLDQLVEDASTVYVAPEALLAPLTAEAKADVFSLGALAWLLFSGQAPAPSFYDRAEKLRTGPGLRISSVVDGVGPCLEHLIQHSTHPEVAQRFDLAEFTDCLDDVYQELCTPDHEAWVNPVEGQPGDHLEGGFEVVKRLGRGSCAVALLVVKGGKEFVLKIAVDPEHNARLQDEAEVLEKLRHQNVVELCEAIELGGRVGLVMKRAGERTLAQRLRDEGRLSLDLLERFGVDLIQTVNWLEEQGIPHRDLKPENIGIAPSGKTDKLHLVLFDFSLSRAPAESIRAGTVPYLDPFLSLRKPRRWDLQAERFSAAMTLYEMATAALPRWGDGKSDPALIDHEVTLDAERFDPAVRERLGAFFAKALRRDASKRFDNCEEMLKHWQKAFEGAEKPLTATDHGETHDPNALDRLLTSATLDTQVALLGLSTWAVNALERLNVHTVGDLLRVPSTQFYSMQGVGDRVRREIGDLVRKLAERFPSEAPVVRVPETVPSADEGAGPEVASVDLLVQRLLPRSHPGADGGGPALVRLWLGLDHEKRSPAEAQGRRESGATTATSAEEWPTQAALAEHRPGCLPDLQRDIHQARERWERTAALTGLRADLHDILLANGGVMAAAEVAASLLQVRGSFQREPLRSRQALAVARAAVETESTKSNPRYWLVREGTRLLVTTRQELADYALRLGEAADELASTEPLPSPARVLETLQAVPMPPDTDPFSTARLVRLAVAASEHAALSSRLELYPRRLEATKAFKLAYGALLGASELTVAQLRERVAARYPDAEELPNRPDLDGLVREAGIGLEWNGDAAGGKGAYLASLRAPGSLTSGTMTFHRFATSTPAAPTSPEVAEAREFEARLERTLHDGAFLALAVSARRLREARQELVQRFDVEERSFEKLFLRHLKGAAEKARVDWRVVLRADAAAKNTRDWQNLLVLVKRAVPLVEQDLLSATRPLLLTHPGLLARYDELSLLDRLRDHTGRADGLPGLWVLVPCDDPEAPPMMDGKPVPVITRAQWARVPDGWLQNVHRGSRPPLG